MIEPSQQFIQKLEHELSLLYRTEYNFANGSVSQAANAKTSWFKLFVPAFSGAAFVVILLLNFSSNRPEQSGGSNHQVPGGLSMFNEPSVVDMAQVDQVQFMTFDEGYEEAEIMNQMDNDEMNQINNAIQFISSTTP